MDSYYIKVYFRYHIWRLRQYWRREGRSFIRDILSAKLFSRIGLIMSGILLVGFLVSEEIRLILSSVAFFIYGVTAHIYRDYRLGRHIGWNRRMKKDG